MLERSAPKSMQLQSVFVSVTYGPKVRYRVQLQLCRNLCFKAFFEFIIKSKSIKLHSSIERANAAEIKKREMAHSEHTNPSKLFTDVAHFNTPKHRPCDKRSSFAANIFFVPESIPPLDKPCPGRTPQTKIPRTNAEEAIKLYR